MCGVVGWFRQLHGQLGDNQCDQESSFHPSGQCLDHVVVDSAAVSYRASAQRLSVLCLSSCARALNFIAFEIIFYRSDIAHTSHCSIRLYTRLKIFDGLLYHCLQSHRQMSCTTTRELMSISQPHLPPILTFRCAFTHNFKKERTRLSPQLLKSFLLR